VNPTPGVLVRTERVVVRRFGADDIDALHAYRNDGVTAAFQGWDVPWPYDEAVMLVAEMAMRDPLFERGEWAQLALERTDTPGLIGDIGVLWQADDDVAEIGFTLAEPHRGTGLMSEALLAVCEEVHRELGLRLVAAITHLVNEPARRVLERIGFAAVALDGEHEVVYAWKPGGWPMVADPASTGD
jgi:aminoglycoside 6'-N-acetyltransferase